MPKLIMTKGLPASGKAVALTTPVLTPNGWVPAGDIKMGDRLIGRSGRQVRVIGLYPQPVGPMFRVTFRDNVQVDVNGEHLWLVRHSNARANKHHDAAWKVLPTSHIAGERLVDDKGRRLWEVPLLDDPVQFDRMNDLPMDPYTLGVFLGDGSLMDQSTTGARHKDHLSASIFTDLSILHSIGASHIVERPGCWGGRIDVPNSLGLMGKRSHEKFIPAEYLLASPEDRLALLQGLLDTDAHAGLQIEFSTTSPLLAEGVCELVRSLGGLCVVKERTTWFTHRGQRKPGRPSFRVYVRPPKGVQPFRLQRKLDSWVEPTKGNVKRHIQSIEPIDTAESVCFTVDAEDGLFVIDGYVLTHNSTWANQYVLDAPAGTVVRLNKDTLREMLHAGRWKGKRTERQILLVRDMAIEAFLLDGVDVLVDDTNLAPTHEQKLQELAAARGAEFLVQDFTDVPLDVCIERDRKRSEGQVGPGVILRMWQQFLRPDPPPATSGRPAIIVDLDGTLAHMNGRSPYDYSKVIDDSLDEAVALLVRDAHARGDSVLVVSGRDDSCEDDTRQWLVDNLVPFDELLMRKTGDKRPDREAKADIYRDHIDGWYDVRYVLDDRDSVVAMWRSLGLKVLQCEYGSF